MDEKQILKEIAYYSRIINQHKKWEQSYQPNKYVKPPMKAQVNFNKYKYVKKNEPSVIIPVQSIAVSTKVLINPNFKTSVHINPHFHIANQQPSTIHVNPKVLHHQLTLNRVQAISEIKLNTATNMCNAAKTVVPKSPARKRRSSIRSKYKIVKSSVLNTSAKCSQITKQFTVANKYKIDRRNTSTLNRSIVRKKIVKYGLSDLIRNKVFRNKTWKKTKVLNHFKVNNTAALTNISGIMYRKSHTKLQKVDKTVPRTESVNKHNMKQRRCLVNIKGCKYVMDSHKRTLKLVANNAMANKRQPAVKKISIKGVTFVQKTKNTYVRRNMSANNLRKFKLHHHSKLQVSSCLRKNNVPCPVYRRFGKCRRKESGRCNFLHNPDQIFLCKKFLQGACIDNECLLSHKVSLAKMPTCKYFLEGCCIRSDCSYLHVKINPKADICRKFLEGFCQDGNKCNKRHQFLCPNFERDGTCPRRKCMYPHKNKTDRERPVPAKKAGVVAVHNRVVPAVPSDAVTIETARYYVDLNPNNGSPAQTTATDPPTVLNVNDVTTEVSDIEHSSDLEPDTEVRRRPQLGALPSFIPFDE